MLDRPSLAHHHLGKGRRKFYTAIFQSLPVSTHPGSLISDSAPVGEDLQVPDLGQIWLVLQRDGQSRSQYLNSIQTVLLVPLQRTGQYSRWSKKEGHIISFPLDTILVQSGKNYKQSYSFIKPMMQVKFPGSQFCPRLVLDM